MTTTSHRYMPCDSMASYDYSRSTESIRTGRRHMEELRDASPDWMDTIRNMSDLVDVAGVGYLKAKSLYNAGYEDIEDLREATQDELSEVDGIGMALAARIKADVGDKEELPEFDDIVEASEEEKDKRMVQGTLRFEGDDIVGYVDDVNAVLLKEPKKKERESFIEKNTLLAFE